MNNLRAGITLLAGVTLIVGATTPAAAGGSLVSPESVVERLSQGGKPAGPRTRSLSGNADANAGPSAGVKLRSIIGKLRAPGFAPKVVTSAAEREQIRETVEAQGLPSLDVEITFATGSSEIRAKSRPDLVTLGLALRDPRLKDRTIMVIGHTDARGSDAANLALSQRRAQAVRKFLVDTFRLDANNLLAVGYGEEQLKDPSQPAGEVNRRVQFVNLAN
ncbi:MAG: OmpA family protein [Pseudomonadota bacterium]